MTEESKNEILDALKKCEIRINKCFYKVHNALEGKSNTKNRGVNVPIDNQFFDKILTKDYLNKAIAKLKKDIYRDTGCLT